MTLADAPQRTPLTITSLALDHATSRRLTEFGLRSGAAVEVLRRAPFGGPLTVRVGSGLVALRREQADRVSVEPDRRDV